MSSIYKLTETDRQAGHRTGTSKYWDVFASKNKLRQLMTFHFIKEFKKMSTVQN